VSHIFNFTEPKDLPSLQMMGVGTAVCVRTRTQQRLTSVRCVM